MADFQTKEQIDLWYTTPYVTKYKVAGYEQPLAQWSNKLGVGTVLRLADSTSELPVYSGKSTTTFIYVENLTQGQTQYYIRASDKSKLSPVEFGSLQEAQKYWPKGSTFTIVDKYIGTKGKKTKIKVVDPSEPLIARKLVGEPWVYASGTTPPGYIAMQELSKTMPTKPSPAVAEEKPKKPSGGGSYTPPPSLPAPPVEPQEAGPNKVLIIAGVAGAVVLLLLLTGSKD